MISLRQGKARDQNGHGLLDVIIYQNRGTTEPE